MNTILQLNWNSAGGFRLPDQWVWCGSAIRKAEGCFLYAACWPATYPMLEGYLLSSRIVLAFSATPEGPYRYQCDIAPQPGSGLRMAHNPTVLRRDGRYYLYFIGSTYPGEPDPGNPELLAEIYRNIRIYLMESDSPTGPWRMHEEPILQPQHPVLRNLFQPMIKAGIIPTIYGNSAPCLHGKRVLEGRG